MDDLLDFGTPVQRVQTNQKSITWQLSGYGHLINSRSNYFCHLSVRYVPCIQHACVAALKTCTLLWPAPARAGCAPPHSTHRTTLAADHSAASATLHRALLHTKGKPLRQCTGLDCTAAAFAPRSSTVVDASGRTARYTRKVGPAVPRQTLFGVASAAGHRLQCTQ